MSDTPVDIKMNMAACFIAAAISAGICWSTIKTEDPSNEQGEKQQPPQITIDTPSESAPQHGGGFM